MSSLLWGMLGIHFQTWKCLLWIFLPHCSTPIFGFLPAVCLCCKLFMLFQHNTNDRRWNFSCRSRKTPHLKRKVPSQTPVKCSRFAARRGGIRRCSFHFVWWKLKWECVFFCFVCLKGLVNVNNSWQTCLSVGIGDDLQEPKWFSRQGSRAMQVCKPGGSFYFQQQNLTGIVVWRCVVLAGRDISVHTLIIIHFDLSGGLLNHVEELVI